MRLSRFVWWGFLAMLFWSFWMYVSSSPAYAFDESECSLEYSRECFGGWEVVGGVDTRQRILDRDSVAPVSWKNGKVIQGYWVCPFTGYRSDNPSDFDIDHLLSLREAWEAGMNAADQETREFFANDGRNLVAVWKSANRSKGSSSSINWLPSNLSYIPEYTYIRKIMYMDYEELHMPYCEGIANKFLDSTPHSFHNGINTKELYEWINSNFGILTHACFNEPL